MLEKDAEDSSPKYCKRQLMYSQAISLKRIADALERLQVPAKQPVIMSAEEYAKYMGIKESSDKAATNLPLTPEEIERIKELKPFGVKS